MNYCTSKENRGIVTLPFGSRSPGCDRVRGERETRDTQVPSVRELRRQTPTSLAEAYVRLTDSEPAAAPIDATSESFECNDYKQ